MKYIWLPSCGNQGAASLMITAKSSFERHQNLNDVWPHCHRHQSFSITIFFIVIVICRHRRHHFFIIFSIISTFKMSFWYMPWLKMKKKWRKYNFVLLVSCLRLSQLMDETDEGSLKPFYCHNTLPEPALKLTRSLRITILPPDPIWIFA